MHKEECVSCAYGLVGQCYGEHCALIKEYEEWIKNT